MKERKRAPFYETPCMITYCPPLRHLHGKQSFRRRQQRLPKRQQ